MARGVFLIAIASICPMICIAAGTVWGRGASQAVLMNTYDLQKACRPAGGGGSAWVKQRLDRKDGGGVALRSSWIVFSEHIYLLHRAVVNPISVVSGGMLATIVA